MLKVFRKQPCDFADFKFEEDSVRAVLVNHRFTNNRAVTRSLITWVAFTFKGQARPLSQKGGFDIEHIYGKERYNKDQKLQDANNLEVLGNKVLLEKSINIRASDYRFEDKKKYYNGYTNAKGKTFPGSIIAEYRQLTNKEDFTEADIKERDQQIHDRFIAFLRDEDLLQTSHPNFVNN